MIAISKACPGWTKTEVESLELGDFVRWLSDIAEFDERTNAE